MTTKKEASDDAEEPQFDIVAFKVPGHRSLLYKTWITTPTLHKAIDEGIAKGANVFSIRRVKVEASQGESE